MTRATSPRTAPSPRSEEADTSTSRSLDFKGSQPGHWVEYTEGLDWRSFRIDPSIQRDREEDEIKDIVENFNPLALGTFTISVREIPLPGGKSTNEWVLVDGQQRQGALEILNYPDTVAGVVHYGLTRAEEAQLFLDLNKRRTIGPAGRYKARLVAEEPQALAIQKMLRDLAIPMGGPKGFSAIQRADRIYESGPTGPADLRWALQMLKEIYGAYDGRVLEAFAMLHAEYSVYIDAESLRSKLQREQPNINKLTGSGKVLQQLYHCTAAMGIAETIIATYNMYTRKDAKTSSALPSLLNRRRKPRLADKEELAAIRAEVDEEVMPPAQSAQPAESVGAYSFKLDRQNDDPGDMDDDPDF